MQAIVLAAGYATRLYPDTKNFPKALLSVGGKPMIGHLVDAMRAIAEISTIAVVSNDKFFAHFTAWADGLSDSNLVVLNDGTAENGSRLGALGDMLFAIEQLGLTEDLLVVAGDNFLRIDLAAFCAKYHALGNQPLLLGEKCADLEMLRRFAVATVDGDGRVTSLVEKPREPEGDMAVFALYLYPAACVARLREYRAEGGNMDAPGNFPQWLIGREETYLHIADGPCYDIGTHESLAMVRGLYGA